MKFLKIEDEIKFSQILYNLKRDIEDFLHGEGYINIEPSIFEEYEEFTDANFKIEKRSTVKLLNNGGDILILSPDITLGIINKFMDIWEIGFKLKIFYYGKTYMLSNSGIKEKRQMGVELIGEKNGNTDENILNTAFNLINKYTDDYLIDIGNSKFLKGLIESCSFNKEDCDNVLNLIYSKNKQELKECLEKLPYEEPINTLMNILDLEGSFKEINKLLDGLYMNDLMREGLEELSRIDEFFKNITDKITYDLSIVSELSYYDGVIFRGYINGSNKEIIRGGRYDSFTEQYGKKVPAIGFSVELDELMKYLYKEGI